MWLQCFAANARLKKLNENKAMEGKHEITDFFLSLARYKAIMKISLMTFPKELEDIRFKEISEIIKINIRPKKRLVIAVQTNFMSLKQEADKSIIIFFYIS